MAEFHDPPSVLKSKVAELAELVRCSRHMVAFTGAGFSTSAGVPDFRCARDERGLCYTVACLSAWLKRTLRLLMTLVILLLAACGHHARRGAQGIWTLRERGLHPVRPATTKLQPTLGHMALVKLQQEGKLKYLISQNTDGFHYRSGFPAHLLSELHGNSNVERCRRCETEFWRPFSTRAAGGVHEHETGRRCERCGGALRDTIVNFGEGLPRLMLERGFEQSARADLHLVIGSSCRVSPAADLPVTTVRRCVRGRQRC